ncbi:MAG: VWA-like domain-containing protein [Sandaracinaceae bacterium]
MPPEQSGPARGVYTHRGTRAIQRMVEYAPATGSLALWVRHRDDDSIDGAVVASTDGATIRYGPSFEALSLPRQSGVVAHEVLHVALRHVPRYRELSRQRGDVDLELFNICADAIVTSALSHLEWLEVDPHAVKLEDILTRVLRQREDTARALLEWDVERLYRAVDDRRATEGRRPRRGPTKAGRRQQATSAKPRARPESGVKADGPRARQTRQMGAHLRRDLVPSAGGDRPEAEAELAREWRERVLRGHAGDGAYSMLRALLADLPRVQVPWEQLLRTHLARGLSRRRARSWSRPSRSYIARQGRMGVGRRLPWEPGWSSGQAVARLAVLLDVSGSIEDELLRRFSGELAAITRRHEARTVVVVGDDRVRSVVHYEPGLTDLGGIELRGGGGTDFSPLLQEADRWGPDIGVFLTDLKGPATYRPGFPVLWVVPRSQGDREHPFGRKLVLD